MPELIFDNESGVGYFPVDEYLKQQNKEEVYNEIYFQKYQGYAATELGRKINNFRLTLTNRFARDKVLDIGIGSGQFIEARNLQGKPTFGYDVNPKGIEYLKERNWYLDPTTNIVPVMTFWDSFEHIKDFKPVINNIAKFLIVSIPIFQDYQHVLKSKHFRKDEHYHYYSHMGFVGTLWDLGLRLVEYCDDESKLGREGIRTYVFKRV